MQAGASELRAVTHAWQNNQISNFDYLLFCNFASGRSFSDLTQYLVFSWILADYTSKTLDLESPLTFRDLSQPMGAIDPQRLSVLLRRFREMPREEVRPHNLFCVIFVAHYHSWLWISGQTYHTYTGEEYPAACYILALSTC